MPWKPKTQCCHGGCSGLAVKDGRCEKHKKNEYATYDCNRGTPVERGYNAQWNKARVIYLRQHPVCVECGKAAQCVDHMKPHRGNMNLFWDEKNWQAMCNSCHSIKTAKDKLHVEARRGAL